MTYIFYDFETSSRELLGQIMSYSFIVTDANFNTLESCDGYIKLNRTQFPEIEAILTNKINVEWLQKNGNTEYEAAKKIEAFLSKHTQQNTATLVGFNSNAFDLGFLRNLLIRYGLNPYFMGKLLNKDVLHFAQYVAFKHPEEFCWTRVENNEGNTYYSFRLEDLSQTYQLLEGKQTHDAKEDVLLTIKLVQILSTQFEESFEAFNPIELPKKTDYQDRFMMFNKHTRHFPKDGEPLQKIAHHPFLYLAKAGKAHLTLDLTAFKHLQNTSSALTQEEKVSCIRYINANKHFVVGSDLATSEYEQWLPYAEKIEKDPLYASIIHTPNSYFSYIKKEWDIDYQIHELGFDRIPQLQGLVEQFMKDPNQYIPLLQSLLKARKDPKDTYLIQLFNRVYLNYHPNPNPNHLQKYIQPRYITGTMNRNQESFRSLEDSKKHIQALLNSKNLSNQDTELMLALNQYYP